VRGGAARAAKLIDEVLPSAKSFLEQRADEVIE
jgi:hypothetical protein